MENMFRGVGTCNQVEHFIEAIMMAEKVDLGISIITRSPRLNATCAYDWGPSIAKSLEVSVF